ncbi:MAG: DUF3365 domain-containing protein [Calditrichaeota bacterium]|nr:DUF3365 domain-containing protein [Candidatus Cloacimonadota bacterium]MCB1045842.1 DUF3365 domain-containing protein [Calditrichota bacterium]MCB9473711.1 DUF3365 domain-containing protein [Candidatus Delongbacteria bacterium]
MFRWVSLPLLLACLSCQPGEPDYQVMSPDEIAHFKEQGALRSGEVMSALMSQLNQALTAKGPAGALDFCSTRALRMTDSLAHRDPAVDIKRVSRKTRNPLNSPDRAEQRALEIMHSHADVGGDVPSELMQKYRRGQRTIVRYYRPIRMGATCLACHGNPADFSPDLSQALEKIYPSDQAVGYGLGELRGLLRVEFSLEN